MILKGYPRISETFISNEIRLLEQRGVPIHIFSMRRPREPFCHPSVREIRARVDYLPETIISRRLPSLLKHNLQLAADRHAMRMPCASPCGGSGAHANPPRSSICSRPATW